MKKPIRSEYLAKRKQFSTTEINIWSQAIAQQFLTADFLNLDTFHIFVSMSKFNEVNTQYIIDELWRQGKDVIVPKMNDRELLNCRYESDTKMVENSWGILEPEVCESVPHSQIDVVFVPLLIADKKGNRIGYGGGYYDRFLPLLNKDTKFVGINFFEPVEDEIPNDDYDILLDYLITPNEIYKFEK